jgi:hypothetical protein
MALNVHHFQPGAALHGAIVAVLHSRGLTYQKMIADLDLRHDQARAATLGLSQGATGKKYLGRILDYAGIEDVATLFAMRMERDLADLKRGMAA